MLFVKMCEARVNSGIVSFSVVSQCVSCNNVAVTLLVCASCSMMVSLELVRPLTFNYSIVEPSSSTTGAAHSEKSAEQSSGPRFRVSVKTLVWFRVIGISDQIATNFYSE